MNNLASLTPLLESIQHLVGFIFVLVILTGLWLFTASVGIYFKSVDTKTATRKTVDFKPTAASNGLDGDVSDEEVAVLTASIMTVVGENSRIVSIKPTAKR